MDINAALYGQILVFFMVFTGLVSYYLAKRKTQTPKLACLLGVVLSIIPPLGLIYLVVLVVKNDVPQPESAS